MMKWNDVVGSYPVAEVGREEHRRIVVDVDEPCGHFLHAWEKMD